MRKFTSTILTTIAALSLQSRAEVCEESPCQDTSQLIDSYRCLIHKAAVVDEDGRRTEEEYAGDKVKPLSAVQNRFAPTGILKCNGSELSAQLTGATDVITTAGHGFVNTDTCRKTTSPESCTFTVKIGSDERVSKISGMVGTGFNCPTPTRPHDDWAVLKIDPPLDGINPYHLPDEPEIKEGIEVTSVSAMARDFVRIDPKTKKKILPKTIEECRSKKAYGIGRTVLLESNCDFGRGNSGGSLLRTINGKDVLVAISVGNRESEEQLRKAERRGTPNTGPYKIDEWATFHVPLNSRFLDTVKKAVGNRSL